jgi:hypothetical protein
MKEIIIRRDQKKLTWPSEAGVPPGLRPQFEKGPCRTPQGKSVGKAKDKTMAPLSKVRPITNKHRRGVMRKIRLAWR